MANTISLNSIFSQFINQLFKAALFISVVSLLIISTDVQAKIGVRIMPGTDSVEGTLGLLVGLFTYKSSFCSCSACSACLPYSIFLAHISAGYTERQVQRLQVFSLLLINMRLGAELPR